jgi:hypothetical protein
MIPRGVEVFVALEPIDLRWSFDRLSGIVEEQIGREARSGALFGYAVLGGLHQSLRIPRESRSAVTPT